jgi:SAM-dependent methyltransferase
MNIREKSDYQHFTFSRCGSPRPTGRLLDKIEATTTVQPFLYGKDVLDIGCDFGYWSFLASSMGANRVVGLDRSRDVRGVGKVDLVKLNQDTANQFPMHKNCKFYPINLGKQYLQYGQFDFVYLMSLYHHIYQCTGGDHLPIWYWLSQHVKGTLLWENPVDVDDHVSNRNIDTKYHANYKKEKILEAASEYFDYEYVGKALHEPNRHVYTFTPKAHEPVGGKFSNYGEVRTGAGGASKAFLFEDSRRIKEIERITGTKCIPGSLNVWTDGDFDWDRNYYRAEVLDVKDRKKGLFSKWSPKWARFYPVSIYSDPKDRSWGYVFRFEGENYPKNLVEVISDLRLRLLLGERVTIES